MLNRTRSYRQRDLGLQPKGRSSTQLCSSVLDVRKRLFRLKLASSISYTRGFRDTQFQQNNEDMLAYVPRGMQALYIEDLDAEWVF